MGIFTTLDEVSTKLHYFCKTFFTSTSKIKHYSNIALGDIKTNIQVIYLRESYKKTNFHAANWAKLLTNLGEIAEQIGRNWFAKRAKLRAVYGLR